MLKIVCCGSWPVRDLEGNDCKELGLLVGGVVKKKPVPSGEGVRNLAEGK